MKILAFVGMPGSGKSLAAKIAHESKYPVIRLGDLTDEELKNRKLKINEENEKIVREDVRRQFGMHAYADYAVRKAEKLKRKKNEIVIFDGVKSFEEHLFLKRGFGADYKPVAIISSPRTRHSRLGKRKIRPLTKEECMSRDEAELLNLNEGSTIAMADHFILNENTAKTKFTAEVKKLLKKLARRKLK